MTDDDGRILAPTVDEVERRFRSPVVVVSRPVIWSGIRVLRTVRRFGWRPDGSVALESLEPPVIFAANHLSHADTAAILGTLPPAVRRRTAVAAALDVFGPVARGPHSWRRECLQLVVAAGFHAFAFDRHGPPLRSVRLSTQLLRNGWNLLLYPEGTRSRSGAMGPFKPGVGVLARVSGRPVVPVCVEGGQSILPHGAFMPRSGHAVVRYGRPLRPEPGERPADFTARLQDRVRSLQRQPQVQAPAVERDEPATPELPRPLASLNPDP
ncbi:MAG: lysophospholipid acyltransferase family protein [Planctomycetota bacterium]|jgi:1-acyl-sn-glycerol-3-phosphate acyltransferase